jgi:hypothetical protein
MRSKRWLPCFVTATALAVWAVPAASFGRIKLITLPVRERVEIQLDHESATLVEEERIVPLVKGENQVDFSWANTQIDPNTIVFRVIAPAEGKALDAKVLSVSYPPNEAALVWAVGASDSGSARVRISYLLGNLSKNFAYRAVATKDEKSLVLSQYMRLQNFANEEFGSTNLWAGFGREFLKPVGLNETKEMLMARFEKVPVKKTYTVDLEEFGYLDEAQKKLRCPMHYVLKNDKANQLGAAPLEAGKVRIFIESGGDAGTAFLGEDWGKFTPVDDEMRLYLGVAQDVVVKRTIERNKAHDRPGNLYDEEVIVKYEIENRKDQPITLDIAENLRLLRNEAVHGDTGRDPQWDIVEETNLGQPDKEKSTFEKLLFHVDLKPRDKDGKAETVVKKLHVSFRSEW